MTAEFDTATSRQGDTVDLICYRHYGTTEKVVAAVLEANKGLSAHGPILPIGTKVNLPVQQKQSTKTALKLWD